MNDTTKSRPESGSYKIKDTYPGRTFSPGDQQRLAAQISGLLTRVSAAKAGKSKE